MNFSEGKSKLTLIHYAVAIVLAATLAIIFSYNNIFPYRYTVGEAWNYTDLYAPAPLAMPISESSQDSLKKRIDHTLAPTFKLNKDLLAQKKVLLEADFKKQLNLAGKDGAFVDVNKSPKSYLKYAEVLLSIIYEQGILPEGLAILQDKSEIQIERSDATRTVSIQKVFTVKNALNAITDSLPASNLREPEFLLSILEDKIEPNLIFDEKATTNNRALTLQRILNHRDTLTKGTLLVAQGATIDERAFDYLEAYRQYYQGGKAQGSNWSRFGLFFLFNSFVLLFLLHFFQVEAPKMLHNKHFGILLIISLFLILTVHYICCSKEFSILISPILILPAILRKHLNNNHNFIVFAITLLIGAQVSLAPFAYVAAFGLGGFYYIYMPPMYEKYPYGKYLHLLATTIITTFMVLLILLQQFQSIQLPQLLFGACLQILFLFATPYLTPYADKQYT